jgi:hypothetical protein
MGFLDSILGKKEQSTQPNPVRETLFGDVPLDRWVPDATNAQAIPWNFPALSPVNIYRLGTFSDCTDTIRMLKSPRRF